MKKFLQFMQKAISNFWVQLIFLVACMLGIFALGGAFTSADTVGEKILEIVTSIDILSIFLAATVSLIVANVIIKSRKLLEESLKIDDDHHKIICRYNKHKKSNIDKTTNFCDKDGVVMTLDNVAVSKKPPKNPISDKYSDGYKTRQADIDSYMNGNLQLPSVSIFANIMGDTKVTFSDRTDMFKLPRFVTENKLALMGAHKTSSSRNNDTIRLDDIYYANGTLTLKTCRTQYYDMLVTNRCMDYRLDDTVSVREIFEYGAKVNLLSKSQLANQIGINGLIFSKDGYLLLEKRGHSKTTWKNKFAQPISLAMKKSDVILQPDGKIGDKPEDANKTFKKIILTTVKKNFGLEEKDLTGFDISKNLFGIARDLLEGGKPNLYFYVVANYTADELVDKIQSKCKKFAVVSRPGSTEKSDEALPQLTNEKLDSDFYLVNEKDIFINYGYSLKVKARRIKRIKREYYPRVNKLRQANEGFYYRFLKAFNGSLKRECGEALLACLYYARVCRDRIEKEFTL